MTAANVEVLTGIDKDSDRAAAGQGGAGGQATCDDQAMKVRIPTIVFFVLSVAKADEPIDLPTTLRLAGANAIEVQLAQQKLEEARGNEQQRVLAFIPTLSVGIGYKNHQGAIQEVGGNVFDVSKNSTALGGTAALDS